MFLILGISRHCATLGVLSFPFALWPVTPGLSSQLAAVALTAFPPRTFQHG